jgi:hypothetical protein
MFESQKIPWWIHAAPLLSMAGLMLILVWAQDYYRGQNVWEHWIESHDLRNSNYTERIEPSDLLRTRANTWSNLAYVFVGMYAICLGMRDLISTKPSATNYLICTPAVSLLFGTTCCYLGFSSGLFHASLTRFGQQLDVGSMYAPLLACIAINLGRYLPSHLRTSSTQSFPVWPFLVVAVVLASYLLFLYKWSMSAGQVLPLHILVLVVFALVDQIPRGDRPTRTRPQRRWLLIAFVALVLGVLFRQLDVAGRFGNPDDWIQGHAIWHLLTAGSLGAIYLYYRSENSTVRSRNRNA